MILLIADAAMAANHDKVFAKMKKVSPGVDMAVLFVLTQTIMSVFFTLTPLELDPIFLY